MSVTERAVSPSRLDHRSHPASKGFCWSIHPRASCTRAHASPLRTHLSGSETEVTWSGGRGAVSPSAQSEVSQRRLRVGGTEDALLTGESLALTLTHGACTERDGSV